MNDHSVLVTASDAQHSAAITRILERFFPQNVLRFCSERGIHVRALEKNERYNEASPALARLNVSVDDWPAPPAGLFVVEERTVYLRSRSDMTVCHEFGHAIDCALGNGVYLSSVDARFRSAFTAARKFLTPYSACGIDEYVAEGIRGFVGANDSTSYWPRVTPERLRSVDATLYKLVQSIFADPYAFVQQTDCAAA